MAQQKSSKIPALIFQCPPDCPDCAAVRQGHLGDTAQRRGPLGAPALSEASGPPPLLTLYPDGQVNLTGEAARLLPTQTEAVQLLPPTGPDCPHWLLLPAHPDEPHTARLCGNAARPGFLRFRARALAVALFALLPTGHPALQLRLQPTAAGPLQLLPVE